MNIHKEIENELESLLVEVEGKRDQFIKQMDNRIKEIKSLIKEIEEEQKNERNS